MRFGGDLCRLIVQRSIPSLVGGVTILQGAEVGFAERLAEHIGSVATLEKVGASVHGARYTYKLGFDSRQSAGEKVILKEVWADCILIQSLETSKSQEIPIERIELAPQAKTPAVPASGLNAILRRGF